ncbi:rod shape-determining protein MreD [Methylobacillus rhizosphaerae]|uniref:Rod shape-determining protein MreD n=1 Tax=Methylobacillus rhizosphaerae TaxID=551994 RepID=A0A238XSK6_9PROT|nr:rod shape-determining protein MreD [Methylobacillus rhizosphaerae]SNR61433.1 rod shape-determining protein MreD [Methylobacillus rhizosphaerae]
MATISSKPVYLSLLLALLCQLLPWSGISLILRPEFLLLTILYWTLRAPHLCNIGTAWFAGILMDLISGGLFGQFALAYTLTSYIAVTYQRRLALFDIWQQAGYVFLLLLLAQLTTLIMKVFAGGELFGWQYFLPSITGILLWLFMMLSPFTIVSHSSRN